MSLEAYHNIIARKRVSFEARGLDSWGDLPPSLFPHQLHGIEFALRAGRKFIGTELKDSYYAQAAKNLREMEERMAGGTLLEWIEAAE